MSANKSADELAVDAFAEILRTPTIKLGQDGYYPKPKVWQSLEMQRAEAASGHASSSISTPETRGYWADLWLDGLWYHYSVSNTKNKISPVEVAEAIKSPGRIVTRSGPYNEGRGWEATVGSGEHFYMLGHGRNKHGQS
jgi:hypothetical protein